MRLKIVIVMVLALFTGMAFMPPIIKAETRQLHINCTLHSPYERFFVRVLEAVCARNNIELVRETPPVGRSLIMVDEGLSDGDGPRIAGLSSRYPNLVRVPESFGEFHFGVFTKDPDLTIAGWESLATLNVAYIHGWQIFDNQVTAARSITRVRNKELLFGLLDAGRADVILITREAGYEMAERMGLQGVRFVEPPLAVKPNFLYLNRRNQDLVAVLVRSLKELKNDGTYDRIYADVIPSYLRGNQNEKN